MDTVDFFRSSQPTIWPFRDTPEHFIQFKKNIESSKLFDSIAFMHIMTRLNDLLIIMTRKNDQELFARNRWLLSHYTSNPCDIDLTRHCSS